MSHDVTVTGAPVGNYLEMVNQLRSQGLKVGVDFDWKYHPSIYNWVDHTKIPGYAIFMFYDAALATFYSLKWK